MTSIRVVYADYRIDRDYLITLAGEYGGRKLVLAHPPANAIEFTFSGADAQADAAAFRQTLDACFGRRAA